MSLHDELKTVDAELRGKSNRRDDLKKAVQKCKSRINHKTQQIKTIDDQLAAHSDKAYEKTQRLTYQIETEEVMVAKLTALYNIAKQEVDTRLEELSAL